MPVALVCYYAETMFKSIDGITLCAINIVLAGFAILIFTIRLLIDKENSTAFMGILAVRRAKVRRPRERS